MPKCNTHGYHVAFKNVQVKGELAVPSYMKYILPRVIFVEKNSDMQELAQAWQWKPVSCD